MCRDRDDFCIPCRNRPVVSPTNGLGSSRVCVTHLVSRPDSPGAATLPIPPPHRPLCQWMLRFSLVMIVALDQKTWSVYPNEIFVHKKHAWVSGMYCTL